MSSKLQELTAASSVLATDILFGVVDPAGTPLDRKIPVSVLKTIINTPAVNAKGDVSGTVNTDLNDGPVITLRATGNITLANPTNPVNGAVYRWHIKQDGTGSRTVTLGNKFVIPASATTPLAWSTTINLTDILTVSYDSVADKFLVVSMLPGYTL